MKKFFRIFIIVIIVGVVGWTFYFLYQKSQKPPTQYALKKPSYDEIISKTVATGSVVPRKEIEIKPQISGIIEELMVEPGDKVTVNQVIAKVRIIPDMVTLNQAEARVKQSKINLEDAKLDFERQKGLYEKEVITRSEFQKARIAYETAETEVETAEDNLQLVKEGVTKKSGSATNTLIKSTIRGMVLDVPIKEGNSVIQSNTFNDGTTIAVVADMGDMIFEGKIDETEVGKIREGMPLLLTIGAIEEEKFDAMLKYISPKGVEENGAIQFEIKADVDLKEDQFIRAGYSANADIVLEKKDSVLVIDESAVQFDGDTAFVEVFTGPGEKGMQNFERKNIVTGLSDGIKIEVKSGLAINDELKGEKIDPKKLEEEKKKKAEEAKKANKEESVEKEKTESESDTIQTETKEEVSTDA